jgi:hypothetical protein
MLVILVAVNPKVQVWRKVQFSFNENRSEVLEEKAQGRKIT